MVGVVQASSSAWLEQVLVPFLFCSWRKAWAWSCCLSPESNGGGAWALRRPEGRTGGWLVGALLQSEAWCQNGTKLQIRLLARCGSPWCTQSRPDRDLKDNSKELEKDKRRMQQIERQRAKRYMRSKLCQGMATAPVTKKHKSNVKWVSDMFLRTFLPALRCAPLIVLRPGVAGSPAMTAITTPSEV